MKRVKKLTAVILVLILAFSLNSTAFASTDDPEVTVYITTGMYTPGGYYPDHGIIDPTLLLEPADFPFDETEPVDIDWDSVEVFLDDIRDPYTGYNAPSTLSSNVNVLDAIWFALMIQGYTPVGGWDSISYNPGGYIHAVYPYGQPVTYPTTIVNIGGVEYYKYSGYCWRIALKYPNNNWQTAGAYATYYTIVDGMEIILDYSYYEIYSPVTW